MKTALLTLAAAAAMVLVTVVATRTTPAQRLISRLKRRFVAQRMLVMVVVWRVVLASARGLGRANRWVFGYARAATLLLTMVPTTVFALRGQRDEALTAGGLWLFGLLVIAAFVAARDRLIIGEFKSSGADVTPPVDLANLLLVEISRLGDLFRVVGDRRTVSSGLTHQQGLDATLSVDDLVENLRGTVSSEAKATVGPVTIPLAPLVTLFGKLLQSPRLAGNLDRDGNVLILTAQTSWRGGLSWRVEAGAASAQPSSEALEAVLSGMVAELALRIYTDVALGRAVRWEASKFFVEGLRDFRACLRTPKDRKVNLKRAEDRFLDALAEDEDFPLAYYNLGVVYTELHGLADAAGRKHEAETRLSAAETSFGRAIEKDPGRWECYFAFAQTQYRYSRYASVVALCTHMQELDPGSANRAKAQELWSRALLERDRPKTEHAQSETAEDRREEHDEQRVENHDAVEHAMGASRLALRSLARARLSRHASPRGEHGPEARCSELATGCLLTFSEIYSTQLRFVNDGARGMRSGQPDRIRRRLKWLVKLAPLTRGKAELRFAFGVRALADDHFELAEGEMAAATAGDPTRPSYAAGLALARARRLLARVGEINEMERQAIAELCHRALEGMVVAFFPSRDEQACEMVAQAYECMSTEPDDRKAAEQLRTVAENVKRALEETVSGASVTGIFLEVLQAAGGPLSSQIGAYGEAMRAARAHWERGTALSEKGEREKDNARHVQALDEFREGLVDAERATSLNPLSTLAWETLGDVHRELSDFQNARLAWKQALGTDPDNPRLYDKIGSSYWHIAFEGRTRPSRDDLTQAAEHFDKALRLYGSSRFKEHALTHYRLAKLNAALREFEAARMHLEIVEAAVGHPPLVGWTFMGFAHLEKRNFPESEFYFGKVVREGERLSESEPADAIIGDRLDEQLWPLGLVRAWGHLGLAMTAAERDGNLDKARGHTDTACELLGELGLDSEDAPVDERFPTRATAAVVECRGLILLREGHTDEAIDMLENAVSQFPHSRAYFELALALEQRALNNADIRKDNASRAQRLLEHAVSLGPTEKPPEAIKQTMDRLGRLLETVS